MTHWMVKEAKDYGFNIEAVTIMPPLDTGMGPGIFVKCLTRSDNERCILHLNGRCLDKAGPGEYGLTAEPRGQGHSGYLNHLARSKHRE